MDMQIAGIRPQGVQSYGYSQLLCHHKATNYGLCFNDKYSTLISKTNSNRRVININELDREEKPEPEKNCISFIEDKSTKHNKFVQFLIVQLFCLMHYFDVLDSVRKYQIEPSKLNILRIVVSFTLGTGKLLSFVFSYLLTASAIVSTIGIGGFGWPVLLLIGLGATVGFLGVKVLLTKTTNNIHKKFAQVDLWLQQHKKAKYFIFTITFLPIVVIYFISKLMGNPTFIGFYTSDKTKIINPSICLISKDLETFFNAIHYTVQAIRVAYSIIGSVGFGFALFSWTGIINGESIISIINSYLPHWLTSFLTKIPTLPDYLVGSTHGIMALAIICVNLIWNWLKFLTMKHVIDVNSKKIISQNQLDSLYIKETNDAVVIKVLKEQLKYRRAILLYIIEEFTHRIKIDSQLLNDLQDIDPERIAQLEIADPEIIAVWLFKSLRHYPFAESCQCMHMQTKNARECEISVKLLLSTIISEINLNQNLLKKRLS